MKSFKLLVFLSLFLSFGFLRASASCSAPANAIEAENCLIGTPQSTWDISGSGNADIQGFATDISVNVGTTVSFKINTPASSYHLDIYRMGYYQGNGARLITTIRPSAKLPQTQPACLIDSTTHLEDCGNWAISASWTVPATAVSGIYFAHLIRDDNGDDSHIFWIVRNDASKSDIVFQTSDETWQAYNDFGGYNFYGSNFEYDTPSRAHKISYNRPFDTRNFESMSWVMYAEYAMVRWLERNSYDITYFTSVDAARNGSLIANHKLYVTVGHDEYWSGPKRASIEAGIAAGVNMAFFTGNTAYWKTRWENSIDGSNTPYRTLVCYKESYGDTVDPEDPPTWTGTWADASKSPPADGGRPANAVTGQLFKVNGPNGDTVNQSIQVPAAYGAYRLWRNTQVARQSTGQTWVFAPGTLGYEWDVDFDNGLRPGGLFDLSSATYSMTSDYLLDNGVSFGAGVATNSLTLYRAPSGALVFGAGTVQWSFGLDDNHDSTAGVTTGDPAQDPNMQQATVNLFADMGVQPATLQSNLVPATKSTDVTPPVTSVSVPSGGLTAGVGTTISGTASDVGGVVTTVEVSADNGASWHRANGTTSWTYPVRPSRLGSVSLLTRASDDSANLSQPTATSVPVNGHDCPCTVWNSSTTPAHPDGGDGSAGEYGFRFTADYDGYITGIRFYKATTNVGTHVGHLWSNTGTLLATAAFSNETASGWQQVNFASPVTISAGTVYVASYFSPNGHYSADQEYFIAGPIDNPPLHAVQDGSGGANGVYNSGAAQFPNSTYLSSNYWTDVVYQPSVPMPGVPSALVVTPSNLNFTTFVGQGSPVPQTVTFSNEASTALSWTATSGASWLQLSVTNGTVPGSFTATANTTGLSAGSYQSTITLTASGAGNSPVTIPVTLTISTLLLTDDFSSGTSEGWAVSPLGLANNWSVVNGAVQYNGQGQTQLYAGDVSWTDYDFNVGIQLSSLSDYPGGIRGRINPATGASYAAWLYPSEGLVRLYKTVDWNINDGFTQIGQGSVAFDTNMHNWTLSFRGTQIQVLYGGVVVLTATDSSNTSGMVAFDVSTQPISFDNVLVTSPTSTILSSLSLGTSSLTFNGTYQQANPASQTDSLSASGSGSTAFTAVSTVPWLTVTPSSGVTPASLSLMANTQGLAGGNYAGNVRITSLASGNSPRLVSVTLNVIVPPPSIALTPSQMTFMAVGQQATPKQSLSITNAGSGSLSWSAVSNASWLTSSLSSGSSPSVDNIGVNTTGLAAGDYTGTITVSAPGVANSPQTLNASLVVTAPDMTENFSDLASGWIISPMGQGSGWTVSNGIYSFSGIGLSQSCAGDGSWTDYVFDANVKLANLNNWPGGVRARVNPSTGAGYAVWLYPGSGMAILYRVPSWNINGTGLTVLAQANMSFDLASHDLQMQFAGSQISVLWDGKLVMGASDATFPSGFVCLDADSQPISYSNIRVSATQATAVSASPSLLVFAAQQGQAPASQMVTVSAGGASTTWAVTSNASWLTAVASSSLTPANITVSVNPTGLAQGTYTGTLTVSAPGTTNAFVTIPVTLGIKTAALQVNPTSLNLFAGVASTSAARSISIINAGTGSLSWTAVANANWLVLGNTSGVAPSVVSVSGNSTGLALGDYTSSVSVNSTDVSNGPQSVSVGLHVGNLLFSDNFSSGSSSNWTSSPLGNSAGWSVQNGTFSYNGGGESDQYAGSNSWTDYSVGVDVKLGVASDWPGGIRGRVNTQTGASYGVWLYPTEGVLKLYRIGQWNIDADFTLLAQSPVVKMDTNWHNVTLSFKGSQIQVHYDGMLQIQATDSTYSQGAVALDPSSQPIAFDNITVISN